MGEENFQIIGADGTRLRPLRGLRPGDGRKRGQAPTVSCLPARGAERAAAHRLLPPGKGAQSGQAPTGSCLPCVRGGAERMRSGGVVGMVQEKIICNRKPVPARYPQPLSPGLRPCQLPFSIAGVSAETPLRHRKAGRARSDGRNHVPPVNPLLFGRKTGDGAVRGGADLLIPSGSGSLRRGRSGYSAGRRGRPPAFPAGG